MKIVKYKDKIAILEIPSKQFNRPIPIKSLNLIRLEDNTLVACKDEDIEIIKEINDEE